MKLRPLFDKLVVKAAPKEEVSKLGIILPGTGDKEKPEQGEVIAMGPGRVSDDGKVQPMTVKIGDKVVFKKYAPDDIKIDGVEYLVISESDVIAVIE